MSIRSSGTPMLTFHRNKRGGDDFHVISEGQRVGSIYRLTSKTEGWFWAVSAEWVPPGGKVNGVADTVGLGSQLLRRLQTGSVRAYAASLALGVVAVLGYYLWR